MDDVIQNREVLAGTRGRELALDCIEAGVRAARPDRVIHSAVSLDGDHLRVGDETYDLGEYREVVLVGGGKVAALVATELSGILGDRIARGAVVTDTPVEVPIPNVEVYEGGHPVPNEESVAGARRVRKLAETANEQTLLLAVITGGGSALITAPAPDVELADVRAVTDAMLDAGMEIAEINAVRKHVSAIKGGNLARAAVPATVVGLVFSDVVGNDLGVIASGPTSPDDSTYEAALAGLDRYGVEVPPRVCDHLERGAAGELPETPDASDPAFDRVHNHVLADGMTALEAARSVVEEVGYDPLVLSSRIRGEAQEVAKVHVGIGEECLTTDTPVGPPAVVLSGGELTVTVAGDGAGGPSAEFCTCAAIEVADDPGLTVAAVDTDGIDGRSDAAGGIVDGDTVADPDDARRALAESDAATYLADRRAAVVTGPTGTNVNDLRVLVVEDD
jgi:hydroxypyruvate reductase